MLSTPQLPSDFQDSRVPIRALILACQVTLGVPICKSQQP